MELVFIYFCKLKFDSDKKFKIEFSNDDEITEILFKISKDYFIISVDCFIELSNGITKLSQFKKNEEISDLANNILISGIDFHLKMDDLTVKDFLGHEYKFKLSKKHRSHFTVALNLLI